MKHGRDQAPAVIHAYNVRALQLLCSSLLWEVSSYRKQKAGGGENGLKVYLISSARSPAKHTMTERSNSCSLLLQDLPSMAHVAWSICSTDSMLAANKQRLYLSKISPFQVDPMACPQWSANSCLAVSLYPQNRESNTPVCFEVNRGHNATHRHMREARLCRSPFGCQLYSDA